MPQIGPLEIMMVALVALLVFGPEKLPDMARSAGRTLNSVRRAAGEMKRELKSGLSDEPSAAQPAVAPEPSTGGEPA